MRKIISFIHCTVDDYIDNPHEWSFTYFNEALQDYILKVHLAADALLLGASPTKAWHKPGPQ